MSSNERIIELPSAGARDRFLQAAARQPASRPGTWLRRVGLAALGTTVWLGSMMSLLGIRHDWHELPMPAATATIVGLLAAAVLASAIGLARGRSMVGAATDALSLAAWGVPLSLLLVVAVLDPGGTSTATTAGALLRHAWPCGLLTVLTALPLIGIARFVLRGLTLSRPGLAGACIGLAAATWGHLLIRVHCAIGGPGHAILGHLLPVLPLMIVGAWAMRRR
jgi:hypothetical protein